MLGRMGGGSLERSINRVGEPKGSLMELSSSSGPSKRAKAPGNGTRVVSCLVDECNSDLSQCREYHRRHKVCELHSKTPRVTIGGREQRFCQQCSRFHSLVEFDEGKRSCRKRLDGHNRRRRKPQSESISRNTGTFLSNQQGTTLLSFSSPQLHASSIMNSAWPGAAKAENDTTAAYSSQRSLSFVGPGHFSGSLAHSYEGNCCYGQKLFSDRAIDSDCALSLLSSAPAERREIDLSHVAPPRPIPPAESLVHSTAYGDLSRFPEEMDAKPVVSMLGLHVGDDDDAGLHYQGMFQNAPDGSSAATATPAGPFPTVSFEWDL
ncbi:teosinte glume architecture 1-like isoform X2 [Diospyros lotus]|uniref:teosinte glume architecture 1-like isoform X2 n=1 Tax=Diospyros lotus TaxID=55363 RepID=UPI002253A4B6|nr:teosinte glume architecture 1-like isoform X2 [Diospyros lotus]